jgi:hypothetical protein
LTPTTSARTRVVLVDRDVHGPERDTLVVLAWLPLWRLRPSEFDVLGPLGGLRVPMKLSLLLPMGCSACAFLLFRGVR